MTADPWRPLLAGDLAARAWEAIRAIAEALAAAPVLTDRQPAWLRAERRASLAGGKAGFALFHAYLAKAGGPEAEAQAALAEDCLQEAIEALASSPMSPGLYSGFTGVAWAAEHLNRLLATEETEEAGAGEDEDISEEIDDALLAVLGRSPWSEQYDLISGLVGFGVYALERCPRPSAVRCLEAVLDRLEETAERLGQGVTWFTPPELIPPHQRELMPSGYYNLGVAHGVPGVIALLAAACRLGVREARARSLLEGAVQWLLSQRGPGDGGPSCYAAFVAPGVESHSARLAWCYGDPGIVATLLVAARAAGRKDWEDEALAIGTRSAQALPEVSGVRDPGLCHGALGLAHLYNRIYQAGGDEVFAEAARRWYRLGLDMRQPEQGVGGFLAWETQADGQMGWVDDPGFLTGAAGIGLSLLAAVTEVEPGWDRILLVSGPS